VMLFCYISITIAIIMSAFGCNPGRMTALNLFADIFCYISNPAVIFKRAYNNTLAES
jgi:hypothetical protein